MLPESHSRSHTTTTTTIVCESRRTVQQSPRPTGRLLAQKRHDAWRNHLRLLLCTPICVDSDDDDDRSYRGIVCIYSTDLDADDSGVLFPLEPAMGFHRRRFDLADVLFG